jgi:hypothetical protein
MHFFNFFPLYLVFIENIQDTEIWVRALNQRSSEAKRFFLLFEYR